MILDVLRDERPVLDRWREEACRQVFHDVVEHGPQTNEEGFRPAHEETVRTLDVDRCTLTFYAIGTGEQRGVLVGALSAPALDRK